MAIVSVVDDETPDYPYRLLAARLRADIASSSIGPKLPSIQELVTLHDVSAGTVQRALKLLKDEGLIYGINGLGTYVKRGS